MFDKKFANVSGVRLNHLCNACGGCQWVCPASAIRYNETVGGYLVPEIDEQSCNGCGLCLSICPGSGFGESLIAKIPDDPFVGVIEHSYVGKATDQNVHRSAQSGGAVTALLGSALLRDAISAAVTVTMVDTLRPDVMLAYSIDELSASQKSKYCPVPILGFLDKIGNSSLPVAVVGLPCHLHGLSNILQLYPSLKPKIAFTIGLICDRVMTFAAIDYLIYKSGEKKMNVAQLDFRSKIRSGYPGDVHVILKNGESVRMHRKIRTRIKNSFTPARCRICFDKLNIFADIVVGDPHGVSNFDQKGGESVVLARTPAGQELIEEAIRGKHFVARDVSLQQIIAGQGISSKRTDWHGYTRAWEELNLPLPNYCKIVQKAAGPSPKLNPYSLSLERSLALDGFPDRDALITKVRHLIWFENFKRIVSLPMRALQRMRSHLSKY
jgi:coenzyme F420 hydrogenase subunit beta